MGCFHYYPSKPWLSPKEATICVWEPEQFKQTKSKDEGQKLKKPENH
jgi:hypothetical protein